MMRYRWLACCLALAPMVAEPCSCAEQDVAKEFAESSAVYEGTVVSIDREAGLVTMRVDTVWKTDGRDLTLLSDRANDPCAFPFGRGKRYIVFATRPESLWSFLPRRAEPLGTSVCALTIPSEVPEEWSGSEHIAEKIRGIRAYLEHAKQRASNHLTSE